MRFAMRFASVMALLGVANCHSRSLLADAGVPSCEAGFYCETPGVPVECPQGFFCTSGVSAPATCDMSALLPTNIDIPTNGGALSTPTIANASVSVYLYGYPLLGNFCPPKSTTPLALCPSGFYCPDPSTKIECQTGTYCYEGSIEENKCPPLSTCKTSEDPGTRAGFGIAVLVAVCVLAFIYVFFCWYMRSHNIAIARASQAHDRVNALFSPLSGGTGVRDLKVLTDVRPRINVEFQNLGLAVNGTTVVKAVTASFEAATLTAVMGPSGAGKTSLLNAVRGTAAAYGTITGTVLINGKPQSKGLLVAKDVVGFVPQDDIVHESLTVRENLSFSAKLRLSTTVNAKTREGIIDEVMGLLGLSHIQHLIVGLPGQGGISGGQRKRVSIGTELVAVPSVVFMDEPTSGLDATSTSEVLAGFKALANVGMNITCVIHQPRFAAFMLFDKVLLLGRGGTTVYQGSASGVLGYFESMGFRMAANENAADFMLDCIAGSIPRSDDPTFSPIQLPTMWEEKGEAYLATATQKTEDPSAESNAVFSAWRQEAAAAARDYFAEQALDIKTTLDRAILSDFLSAADIPSTDATLDAALDALKLARGGSEPTLESLIEYMQSETTTLATLGPVTTMRRSFPVDVENGESNSKKWWTPTTGSRSLPNFFLTTWYLLHRAVVKAARSWRSVMTFVLIVLLVAIVVSFAKGSSAYPNILTPSVYLFANSYYTLMLVFGMVMGPASIRIFGTDREISIRETGIGVGTLPLFLSLNIVHLFDILVMPLLFSAASFIFVAYTVSFGVFYGMMLGVAWYASGLAYLCTSTVSSKSSFIIVVCSILVMNAFINGTTNMIYRSAGSVGRLLVGLSYVRWGAEAALINDFGSYDLVYQPAGHFQLANLGFCGLSTYPLAPSDPGAVEALAEPLTTLDINTPCSGYSAWDWAALFLLGFSFRVFAFLGLWGSLRPEHPGVFKRAVAACGACWPRKTSPPKTV